MWYKRDLSSRLTGLRENTVGIISGPRQTGKTALLLDHFGSSARLIECDDLNLRTRLNQDPALVLGELHSPLIIDEAQYAPSVFPELKLRIDRAKRIGIKLPPIWITGSNETLMGSSVRESLAGRSQHFYLNTFSIHELGDHFSSETFLVRGGWPELNAKPGMDEHSYLDDYIRTFVERDIALSAGVSKLGEFLQALRLMAARTGQILNASEVGGEIGVKGETFQNWIQILERNGLVTQVKPYSQNLNKRLIKSPKFFMNDLALATRLQGWQGTQALVVSPLVGHLFETAVFGELLRCKLHFGLDLEIFHYRTKEGEEIDFVVQTNSKTKGPQTLSIEAKYSRQGTTPARWPTGENAAPLLREKWLVSLNPEAYRGSDGTQYLPITQLTEKLLQWAD